MIDLFRDYMAHNVRVGAIDIDSTWETGYNTFAFDSTKCVARGAFLPMLAMLRNDYKSA